MTIDVASSASRQHFIDTGHYLLEGGECDWCDGPKKKYQVKMTRGYAFDLVTTVEVEANNEDEAEDLALEHQPGIFDLIEEHYPKSTIENFDENTSMGDSTLIQPIDQEEV